MATLEETQKQLDEANERVTAITTQLKTPASAAVRASLKAQLTAAEKEVTRLEKAIKPLEKAAKQAVKEAEAAVTAANLSAQQVQIGITQRKSAVDASSRTYQKDPANEDKWAKFQKDAQNLYEYEKSAIAAGSSIIPSITLSAGTYSIGTPPPATPTGVAPTVSQTNIPGPTVRVGARPSTTTKTATTAKPADGSAERAEEARLAGLKPSAGGGGGGGGKPPTTKPGEPPKPAINILDELADRFPAYRDWTVEQATGYFGADLIQVLNDVAAGKYGVGKEKDRDAIERAIRGTDYWNRTENSIRTWDSLDVPQRNKQVQQQKGLLAQSFGELGLDDATLTELATTIQRTGLNDLGARQLVFGAAFTKPRTETGVQPRQLALESSVADEIRKIGKAYNYAPRDLDAQIESILTGKPYGNTGVVLTKDAFRQKAEKLARGSFGHLKDQFDSGLSLEDIFGNYRELASRVLEIDPNSIDFVKDPDKWLPAFGDAKTGQMSLSDWVAKLKSDEKYNWQFTNQARQQATNLVMDMEKAFGFRR